MGRMHRRSRPPETTLKFRGFPVDRFGSVQVTGAAHRANGDEGMLARSRSERASGRTRNQKHTLFPAEEMSASLSPTFWHRSRAPAWSRALAKSRRVRRLLWAALKFPTGYRSCLCPFQNKTHVVVPVPVVVVNRPPFVLYTGTVQYLSTFAFCFLSSRTPLPGPR